MEYCLTYKMSMFKKMCSMMNPTIIVQYIYEMEN